MQLQGAGEEGAFSLCGVRPHVARADARKMLANLPFGVPGVILGAALLAASAYYTVAFERLAMARYDAQSAIASLAHSARSYDVKDSTDLADDLLHIVGMVEPSPATLSDPDVGVETTAPAAALTRIVETYQRSLGSSDGQWTSAVPTQTARTVQGEGLSVKPEAYVEPPLKSAVFEASSATVAGFALSSALLAQMQSVPFGITATMMDAARRAGKDAAIQDCHVGVYDGAIYSRSDGDLVPAEINDFRIRYEYTPASEVSILARARGNMLQPFVSGSAMLKPIQLLDPGRQSPEDMIREHSLHEHVESYVSRIMLWTAIVISMMLGLQRVIIMQYKDFPLLGSYAVATSAGGMGFSSIVLGSSLYVTLLVGLWHKQDPWSAGVLFLALCAQFVGVLMCCSGTARLREIDD